MVKLRITLILTVRQYGNELRDVLEQDKIRLLTQIHTKRATDYSRSLWHAPPQTNYRMKSLEHYNEHNPTGVNKSMTPSTPQVSEIDQLLSLK